MARPGSARKHALKHSKFSFVENEPVASPENEKEAEKEDSLYETSRRKDGGENRASDEKV